MKKKRIIFIFLLVFIFIFLMITFMFVSNSFKKPNSSNHELESEANRVLKGITDYCQQEKTGIAKTTFCKDETTLKENLDKIVNLDKIDKENIKVFVRNYQVMGLNLSINNTQYGLLNNKMQQLSSNANLIAILLNQYNEDNRVGLLRDGKTSRYYYKGTNDEVINNYLWYGGHQWRVLEFDIDKKLLKLITQQPLTSIQPAQKAWIKVDNQEETQLDETAYDGSYVDNWLNDYFLNSLKDSIKNNIKDTKFNIGVYDNPSELKIIRKVGLLDELQYKNAGGANSYLDIKDYWWLGNRYDEFSIRNVSDDGILGSGKISDTSGVRAVITISDIKVQEGNGTLDKNYKISEKVNNTSLVQVGDYIKVPYNGTECNNREFCMFRVSKKNDNSVGLILNGLLKTSSQWANNAKNHLQTSDLIYTNVLTPFVEKIDSNYLMMDNKFGVGNYPWINGTGKDYIIAQSSKINAKVGLPVVGEMFSGNDIDMGKTEFIDKNLVENSLTNNYYWTMNRYDDSFVRAVYSHGGLRNNVPLTINGVRPVIFLKNNLKFLKGDGSPSAPYELELSLISK